MLIEVRGGATACSYLSVPYPDIPGNCEEICPLQQRYRSTQGSTVSENYSKFYRTQSLSAEFPICRPRIYISPSPGHC
jgi:hypothetical protein